MRPRSIALLATLVGPSVACDKSTETVAPDVVSATADEHDCDKAATMLVVSLQERDFDQLHRRSGDPLTHDLSKTEFEDLAAIIQWLGPLQSRDMEHHDGSYGGGQRVYAMRFDRGEVVQLEVSIEADGRLVGFEFSGEGYLAAERGVLAEPWREFKVYDFHLLDPEGSPIAEGKPVDGKRVEYEVVVGGIEAMLGEHHLSVEKIVRDAQGETIFREPIEFDTKFDEDAMGVPRGSVRGHVEVPGPGKWTLELRITDENAHRDIEHQYAFETR